MSGRGLVQTVQQQTLAANIASVLAEARERGSKPETLPLEGQCWSEMNAEAQKRVELHYARESMKLFGRMVKKAPKLESFPLFEAREHLKKCVAEATRCYLLNMPGACTALCRAAIEAACKDALGHQIDASRNLKSLIDEAGERGILGPLTPDAHFVRERANEALHREITEVDVEAVLTKTRRLIGQIGRNASLNPNA